MKMQQEIFEEINGISNVIANIGNENPYAVPLNYFATVADEITDNIKISELFKKPVTPFEVPENYFDNLSNNILSKIKQNTFAVSEENEISAELETIAPLLNTINKRNVYSVPDEYFNSFSVNISKKPVPAKVINLFSRRKWLGYVVAAVITGIVATAGFYFFDNTSNTDNPYQQLSKINITDGISKLSDAEINAFLNTQSAGVNFDNTLNNDSDDNTDIQEYLNNISDDEIQQYLNNNKNPATKKLKRI
jgi:hypothetical protein